MSSDNDDTNKHDLTRIEDLSEFLHEEDHDTNSLFDDQGDDDNEVDDEELGDDEFQEDELKDELEDESFDHQPSDFETDTTDSFYDLGQSNDQDQTEQVDEGYGDYEDDQANFTDQYTISSEDIDSQDDQQQELPPALPPTPDLDQSQEADSPNIFDDNQDNVQEGEQEDQELSPKQDTAFFENDDFEYPEDDFSEQESTPLEKQDEEKFQDSSPQDELLKQVPHNTKKVQKEDFNDVKEFASNMSYGTVATGGNPAFSLLLKGIRANDSQESILATLNEHGLINAQEELVIESIKRGHLLIPQISEYSAIYLAGKLRKYVSDITIGLAEQIYPSKSYEHDNRGSMTKRSIFQNRDLKYRQEERDFLPEDIISSTANKIHGHFITSHLGVITTDKAYDLALLSETTREFNTDGNSSSEEFEQSFGQTQVYDLILKSLKDLAYQRGANALLNLSYTLSPVIDEIGQKYHIIATADAVIIEENLDG